MVSWWLFFVSWSWRQLAAIVTFLLFAVALPTLITSFHLLLKSQHSLSWSLCSSAQISIPFLCSHKRKHKEGKTLVPHVKTFATTRKESNQRAQTFSTWYRGSQQGSPHQEWLDNLRLKQLLFLLLIALHWIIESRQTRGWKILYHQAESLNEALSLCSIRQTQKALRSLWGSCKCATQVNDVFLSVFSVRCSVK